MGYSLIELIFCIAILAILSTSSIIQVRPLLFKYYAALNLQQIATTIFYARSIAISTKAEVKICPGTDKLRCSADWSEGILVITPKIKKFIPLYKQNFTKLTLSQSGFHKFMVIEPNGMSKYNGSFNYTYRNYPTLEQYKLYFNKALRLYTTQG